MDQFFAGIGGEDRAGEPPQVRSGCVGPGQVLQPSLGDEAEVVATVYCGDDYFNEHEAAADATIVDLIRTYTLDLVVAGPAFSAGRYGLACGRVCSTVADPLRVPTVTGMSPENPGVELSPSATITGRSSWRSGWAMRSHGSTRRCPPRRWTTRSANKRSRRPDVVLCVNGLPLAVLELKNAADENATIWSAFQQLQTYKAEVPSLFAPNALLAVSADEVEEARGRGLEMRRQFGDLIAQPIQLGGVFRGGEDGGRGDVHDEPPVY